MTNKQSEFERINRPRAERAAAQVDLILNSAASMRLERDVALDLLAENGLLLTTEEDTRPQGPSEPHRPAQSLHVEERKAELSKLDTQSLVDIMIAAGALRQDRRK